MTIYLGDGYTSPIKVSANNKRPPIPKPLPRYLKALIIAPIRTPRRIPFLL